MKPFKWQHKGTLHDYFYTETLRGLLQLVQMGTVEFHPWGTRYDNMDCPNWAIFDLDPDEAVPFEAVKLAAIDVKQRLEALAGMILALYGRQGASRHRSASGGRQLDEG